MPISDEQIHRYREAVTTLGDYQLHTWTRWSNTVQNVPLIAFLPPVLYCTGAVNDRAFVVLAFVVSGGIFLITMGYRRVNRRLLDLHTKAVNAVPTDYPAEPWP